MTLDSSGGRMTWSDAISGPLAGCTCLWQDLDGLHVEPPPADPPPASSLWGWRGESALVRVRLDGDIAYVATHDPATSKLTAVVPWSHSDGRVAASAGRGPGSQDGGVGTRYEQVVVGGIDTGPVTFIRPIPDA